jgi:hypothetical protein
MRSMSRKKSMENCQSDRFKSPRRWREMRRIQELKQDKKRFVRQRKSNRETGKNLATTELVVVYSSDIHAGTMPSGIDVDVRKSMKLQAKVGRANRQQQRRKMESSGYSGSRGRTLIEGGTVYILIRFCVCVCVRALYSSMVFHCLMRSADVCV